MFEHVTSAQLATRRIDAGPPLHAVPRSLVDTNGECPAEPVKPVEVADSLKPRGRPSTDRSVSRCERNRVEYAHNRISSVGASKTGDAEKGMLPESASKLGPVDAERTERRRRGSRTR
ncbi:MAG: hypothetical protein M3Q17_03255 [Actinomycetota bacterium]|nr:hypothetical protein [Actinomycetota bacterium]